MTKPTTPQDARPTSLPAADTAPSHTPGPWNQNDHPERRNQLYVRLGNSSAHAVVEQQSMFEEVSEEDLANARLIAAAPDLLSCLEAFCIDHSPRCGCPNCAVIRKAKGDAK